jgi:hypothetical protein
MYTAVYLQYRGVHSFGVGNCKKENSVRNFLFRACGGRGVGVCVLRQGRNVQLRNFLQLFDTVLLPDALPFVCVVRPADGVGALQIPL